MFGRKVASLGLVACVGLAVAPPAHAEQYGTVSFLRWGGPSLCIWVTSPTYGNYWATATDYVCDDDRQVVVNTPALSGQWVGADPIITTGVSWAGCSVVINGRLDYADYAEAGDGHNVNCLRVLL